MKLPANIKLENFGARVPPAPLVTMQQQTKVTKGHEVPAVPPQVLRPTAPVGDPIADPNAGHLVPAPPPTTSPPPSK